jgi:hypothetical protein
MEVGEKRLYIFRMVRFQRSDTTSNISASAAIRYNVKHATCNFLCFSTPAFHCITHMSLSTVPFYGHNTQGRDYKRSEPPPLMSLIENPIFVELPSASRRVNDGPHSLTFGSLVGVYSPLLLSSASLCFISRTFPPIDLILSFYFVLATDGKRSLLLTFFILEYCAREHDYNVHGRSWCWRRRVLTCYRGVQGRGAFYFFLCSQCFE